MALARWQATIVDEAGNVQPGASVEVRAETVGSPLVSIFSDRDGLTPLGNPFPADGDGFAAFHVAGGAYRITATLGGFSRVWRYVGIGTASELDSTDEGVVLVQAVDAGYALNFETGTAAPPGAGAIRFNNADLSLATEAYVSVTNAAGSNIEDLLLDLFDAARTRPDGIIISNPATGVQAAFQVDGAIADGASPGAYVTLTLSNHSGATSFPAGIISFQRERAGVDGAPGTPGASINTRESLTANRTYYVRTDGNNANTGLIDSAGGAFLTVQRALDVVYGTLDLSGFDVTIQVRDGTFSGANVVTTPQVGKGSVILQGNVGTPANVVLNASAIGEPFGVVETRNFAVLFVRGFSFATTTSGSCLQARNGGVIYMQNCRFGATAHYHMHAASNSYIEITGNYEITGGAEVHFRPGSLSEIRTGPGLTITLTGTPAFSVAFCQAYFSGIATVGATYSGAATGLRFQVFANSVLSVAGGLNDLPGNAAGTVASGGIYIGLVDYASDAQVRSSAAGRFVLTADKLESAAAQVTLTDAATVAVDWSSFNYGLVVLAGNRALGVPTNGKAGQYRTIRVAGNDATPRTLTFAGYGGGQATLTDITNAKQYLLTLFATNNSTFVLKATQSLP